MLGHKKLPDHLPIVAISYQTEAWLGLRVQGTKQKLEL